MKKRLLLKLSALFLTIVLNQMTVLAGIWENTSSGYQYQKDDGTYARAEWVSDNGKSYYLDQNGRMISDTTTPDGYLVSSDGSWVTDTQVTGGYVRTPYDNRPYRFDPASQMFIFDEDTDYAWVNDMKVLAAVHGIIPTSELSEKQHAVFDEVCKFLVGFDYGASDYEKAKLVYEEVTGRAVYNDGAYTQADDEAYSILITGNGKCVGFARTYKLLANAVGLKSGIRENGAHMWNSVYVDGVAKSIDPSTVGTSAEFYLDVNKALCPICGYENLFGNREMERPCRECGNQMKNPKYN